MKRVSHRQRVRSISRGAFFRRSFVGSSSRRWCRRHCWLLLGLAHAGVTRATASSCAVPLSRLLQVSDLDGAAAALCFWGGATPSELASLASAHVELSSAKVTFTQRSVSRTVAIPRPLAKSLKPLMVADQPWVFGRGCVQTTSAAMAQRVARWLNRQGEKEAGNARALRAYFQRYAEAHGWNSDEIRGQLRRPSLPPRPLASPSHRRLASLVPPSK